MTRHLTLFQRIEFSVFFGYLESKKICRKCFIRSHFKPSVKKSFLYTPFPFGNLPLSHPCDPPWGIFSGTTQCCVEIILITWPDPEPSNTQTNREVKVGDNKLW